MCKRNLEMKNVNNGILPENVPIVVLRTGPCLPGFHSLLNILLDRKLNNYCQKRGKVLLEHQLDSFEYLCQLMDDLEHRNHQTSKRTFAFSFASTSAYL